MSLLIGVPREVFPGEKRVATVPDVVGKLIKLGFRVAVESGAGEAANFTDDAYRAAGAELVPSAAELWAKSDIIIKVRPPSTKGGLLTAIAIFRGFRLTKISMEAREKEASEGGGQRRLEKGKPPKEASNGGQKRGSLRRR